MVDLIDKLATGNAGEQVSSGRRANSRSDSTAGFRAVLQDVAAEPSADTNASDSPTSDSRTDARDGNPLPNHDQNLPPNSGEEQPHKEQIHVAGNISEGVNQTSSVTGLWTEGSGQEVVSADADNDLLTTPSSLDSGLSGQDSPHNQRHTAFDGWNPAANTPTNDGDPGVKLPLSQNQGVSSPYGVGAVGREPVVQLAYQSSGAPQQPQLSGELGELIKLIEGERPSALLPSQERQVGLQNALAANAGASIQSPASSQLGPALTSMDVKSTASGSTDPMVSAKTIEHISIEKLALNAGSDLDAVSELHRNLLSRSDRPAVGVEITALSNGAVGGVLPPVGSALGANSSALADGIARGTPMLAAGDPESFSTSMATHLRVMKSDGVSEARLQLNPAELGRLSIQIASQDSEVKVSFMVESQQAKQVIENAMPRLRELLDGAGLDLTDSGVDQRRQDTRDASPQKSNQAAESDTFVNDSGEIALVVTVDPNRLVDAYA